VTTSENLIASVEDAVGKGKLKVSAINDYTAETAEIEISLPRGVHSEQAIVALYAYTNCEMSISTNCLVIVDERPEIMTISDVLRHNTDKLVNDLTRELEIQLEKLEAQFHAKTLAQIFIENRIYKRIEECESQEAILAAVHEGLKPFLHLVRRDVTDEDVEALLRIPIRRISLFDIRKHETELAKIEADIAETKEHLANIINYTVAFLRALKKKYAHLFPRRTRIKNIDHIDVREIALSNVKVGIDRAEGYVGTGVKSEEYLTCTEFDRVLIIKPDGSYKVVPLPDKLYVGRTTAILKADKDQIFSMIYRDRKTKLCYAKRFKVDKYIMDKDYASVPSGCKIDKFFDRYGVVARCEFEPAARQKVSFVDVEFDEVPVRGAKAKGYKIANKKIVKVLQIKRGSEYAPEDESGESVAAGGVQPAEEEEHIVFPQPPDDSVATNPSLRGPMKVAEPKKRKSTKKTETEDAPDAKASKRAPKKKADVAEPAAKKSKQSEPADDDPGGTGNYRISDEPFELG
jgi:topoisomerase-4 subunit A